MNWLKRYFLLILAALILLAGWAAIAWTLAQREAALRHQTHTSQARIRLHAAALQLQAAVAEVRQLSIELAHPSAGETPTNLRGQARMNEVITRNPLIGGLALIRHLSEHDREPFELTQGLKVQMFYQSRLTISPPMNDYYVLESYLPDNASALPLGVDVGGLASWSYALRDSRRDREPRLVTDNPGAEQQPQLYLIEAIPTDALRWLVLKIAPNALLDRTLRAPDVAQAELRIILSNGNDRLLDSQPNVPPLDPSPLATATVKLGGQTLTLAAFELANPAAFTLNRDDARILAPASTALLLLWLLNLVQTRRNIRSATRLLSQQQQLEEGSGTLRQQMAKREQTEQALAESEARQRALLLASTDAILLIDQNGLIRSANPTAASLIGQSAQSLMQLPVSALVASFYRPDPDISFDKVAAGKLGQPFETELIRVDNQRIPVEISLSRVVRPDEEFFVAVCRNIQQRKLQETALLELQVQLVEQVDRQSRQLAALLEASPLAMAYVVDGRFREVNRVFLDLFEHDQLSVIDQPTSLLFGNDDDWTRHSRAAALSLNTGQVFQSELTLLTGEERWIMCRLYGKALNPAAPKLGAVWLYQDISIQKATEAALTEAKELAEQTSRAKTEFLANMSHELRTPMHAILGFAEMGLNRAGPDDNPKLKHYFERVHLSGSRLLSLLNELLDLAKMEIGRMEYRIDRHDLAAVIQEAYEELAPMAAHAGSRIELAIEPSPLLADFDAFRIGQVLRNLLSNAIKYNPSGETITVKAHLLGGATRELISVTVRDHGPGIPAAELDSIFDKFIQSSTTKTGAGGTGLGLAICREIVHAHQGMIRAGNAPDSGAELRFTLPRWNTGSTEEGVMHDPHFTGR
jgi:PAS domain S-box-containing protein